MTKTQERAATATAALLLQLLFILLFAHFLLVPTRQQERARELELFLRPLLRAQPQAPLAPSAPTRPGFAPPLVAPPQIPPTSAPSGVTPAPPSALEAFGRALFGCTPEAMGKMSPQDRAKCPPLAEAPKPDQDLLAPPRSHAKDEALWAEEKAERDWMPNCVGAEQVAKCMMHQAMAEQQRAQEARARIYEERQRRNRGPAPPLPQIFAPRATP